MAKKSKYKCSYTKIVNLTELVPNPKNPNEHPKKQIEMLAKIIDFQGQRAPIVVSNRSGFIVKGHGRLEAIQSLGWDKAAVDYQDYESEAQEYADLIADNKIAELAKHDDSMMIEGLKDLGMSDFDFELLGMENFELPIDPDEAKDAIEDEIPENVDTRCKLGDVWILGEHRLVCGDSTSIDAVDKLMNGAKADMVFTDPPYGMNLDTDYTKMPIAPSGAKPLKHKQGFVDDFSVEMINSIIALNCEETFIFGADYFAEHLLEKNKGSWIVWDKRVTENFDKMIGSAFELCWSKSKHKREIARFNNTLFSGEADAKNKVHPTQKPIKLVEWFLEKWCKGKLVADLFGGSGSTLIACEKTNRKCYMMELDPHYCDVILSRWEKYSGKTASIVKE